MNDTQARIDHLTAVNRGYKAIVAANEKEIARLGSVTRQEKIDEFYAINSGSPKYVFPDGMFDKLKK